MNEVSISSHVSGNLLIETPTGREFRGTLSAAADRAAAILCPDLRSAACCRALSALFLQLLIDGAGAICAETDEWGEILGAEGFTVHATQAGIVCGYTVREDGETTPFDTGGMI